MTDQESAPGQEPTVTPLDEIRAEFAKRVPPATLFKRFPGRNGKLVGEYKITTKDDVRAAADTQNDEFLLSQCILKIYREDPEHPAADENGLVPLGAWAGRPELDPLRFDHRLADLLGIVKGTPAQIELELFDGNDLQLAEVAGNVAQWSVDTKNEAYSDFKKG